MPATPVSTAALESLLINGGINLVAAILILIAGWLAAAWTARWIRRGLRGLSHFDQTLTPLVAMIARYVILAAAIIAVLQRFGFETTSLVAILGAAGLAIGLALQGTMSNVAAGVMLLILRPFRVGEYIQAGGRSGEVREIGLFTTILVADDLSYVSVPNALIFSGVIVNSSREPFKQISFTVSIDYSNDIEQALGIVLDALSSDRRILKTPLPLCGIAVLREHSVDLVARCAVSNSDQEAVLFAIQKDVISRFHDAGIAMPARRQVSTARPEPKLGGQAASTTH